MPVHPLIAARLPLIARLTPGTPPEQVPEEALAWFAPYGEYTPPAVPVESAEAEGPHGPVPVRVYRGGDGGAVLVWVHGGGFTSGDLDMPEAHVVATEVAARTGATVVSVGYRLAGEGTRYPVPLDDVVAAWRWSAAGAGEWGADPGRLAIGGASAGANLAASAVLRLRAAGEPLPASVRLAYPALHFPTPALADDLAAAMRELPPALRFTPDVVTAIFREYLGRITDIPAAESPGLGDLTGFPPVVMVLSEYDDLRGSGELFAEQLAERGVPVRCSVAEGMLHGHLNLPPIAPMPAIGWSLDALAEGL